MFLMSSILAGKIITMEMKSDSNTNGWVKIHRGFLDWEWYDDINTKILFLHCIIRANHAPKKWRGIQIERGQFYTSLETLSLETGLTQRQVRTCFDKLKTTGELTSLAMSRGRMVTVNNYHDHQLDDRLGVSRASVVRQPDDRLVTANKNDKNNKNEKELKRKLMADAEEIYQSYPRKVAKQPALKAIIKALKNTPAKEILDHLKGYSDSVKDKESNFLPHCATYFNEGRHTEPIEIITKPVLKAHQL